MSTINVKGALYYDTSRNANVAFGSPYRWYPGEMEGFGSIIPVCPLDITADIGDFDPRLGQIKSLEEQRQELKAQFAAAVIEIERQISELQAIEYDGKTTA